MNTKELEALVIKQGEYLQAVEKKAQANLEAHMHLVQRADNIVEGFKQELAARDERLEYLLKTCEALHDGLGDTITKVNELQISLSAAMDKMANENDEAWVMAKERLSAFEAQLTAVHQQMSDKQALLDAMCDVSTDMKARTEKLETLVLARNASAATKRNMTDEDALRVLTGDLRETSHKEAAEKIGLTYAQVYSCRLEFTFKHVHKDLRDNVKDWKNVWAK